MASEYFKQRMAEIKASPELFVRTAPSLKLKPVPPSQSKGKKGIIYFIRDEWYERVKIGFATDIWQRLHNLQTGSADKLMIEHSFHSYQAAEKMLHKFFKKDHIRAEWFRVSDDIEEFIDDLWDYQGSVTPLCDSPDDFLDAIPKQFFELEDVQFIMDSLHKPWPEHPRDRLARLRR